MLGPSPFHCFFLSFFFFYWCGQFLKSFPEFVPILLLFKVSVFSLKVCGISALWPGIRPTAPALEGEVLTTASPGESLHFFWIYLHLICTERFSLTSFLKFLTLISDYIVNQSKMVKHLLLKTCHFFQDSQWLTTIVPIYFHLQCRRPRFNSWVRKIPWRRDRLPTPVFLGFPGGLAGKESTCIVGDLDSIPGLGRSPGEGKGYPLQYSCLENSMDHTVHGVAKSWTRLSNLHLKVRA